MVTEEEIEQVTKLMKIDVHDHKEFIDKVHAMIDYLTFWILQVCLMKRFQ